MTQQFLAIWASANQPMSRAEGLVLIAGLVMVGLAMLVWVWIDSGRMR